MLGSMLLGIERTSSLISRSKIYEQLYFKPEFEPLISVQELEKVLYNLYARTLQFLVAAHHFFSQNTISRTIGEPREAFLLTNMQLV